MARTAPPLLPALSSSSSSCPDRQEKEARRRLCRAWQADDRTAANAVVNVSLTVLGIVHTTNRAEMATAPSEVPDHLGQRLVRCRCLDGRDKGMPVCELLVGPAVEQAGPAMEKKNKKCMRQA